MTDLKNIATALAKAQTEMGPALKQSNNPAFRSKYADLGNVIDACLPALNSNGIAVVQPIGQDDIGMFVATKLVHVSGESLECRVPLIVSKQDMQGFGSAVTYARRYGLMAMSGIAPEDDDGNAAAKAAPAKAPVVEAMQEAMQDAWEAGVLDAIPENATPQQKAEAFTDAIITAFRSKGLRALDNEWERRSKIIRGLENRFPEMHAQVVAAYDSRRAELEADTPIKVHA